MRHWIGVYFSVPDSELKNCKEAGLFLLAVDRVGIILPSFPLVLCRHFFVLFMPLWFSRLPVAYWGVYMVCFGSQCLIYDIFPISFDVHVFYVHAHAHVDGYVYVYVEASGLPLFIIDDFLILILASSRHSTPHVTRS